MAPPSNILIYRLGSLGDTIIALPCFHLVRKVFPGAKITLLTNVPVSGKAAPAMAILQNSGLCDAVIHYPVGTRSLSELAKIRKTVKEIHPDMLVNLAAGRGWGKSLRDELFFRYCGIGKIVGTPFREGDLEVQHTADGIFEPESQRLVTRLASLGSVNLADRQVWQLGLTAQERNRALELLPATVGPFVTVSMGTKVGSKDWGAENWEKLLAGLSWQMPNVTLTLIGSSDEKERSEKISRAWVGNVINLCGETAPRIAAAILERARLFIGHDSGPMHLASVVGTPTLGLFSWHNPPGQWYPGHKSWKSIKTLYPPLPAGGWTAGLQSKQGDAEGIRLLQPDYVLNAAMELWQGNPNSAPSLRCA